MNLVVAVCDDEPIMREEAKKRILEQRSDYSIDLYDSGELLLESARRYDMIFLDIEMPGMDGMSVAGKLRERKILARIIFLTSHTEFMADAFKVRVFRYLEKPVEADALAEALTEAEKEIFEDKKQIVTDYGSEMLINISDILYIEAQKNRTVLHMLDDDIETNSRLKYWAGELGHMDFIQVHKTYLVSLRYVKKLDEEKLYLMEKDIEIPLARRKAVAVRNAFFEYVRNSARYI